MEKQLQRERHMDGQGELRDELSRKLSALISNESCSVINMGAESMGIRKYIERELAYFSVDFESRSTETIVCDFHQHQFSREHADTIIVCGCLEYVQDTKWFLQEIGSHTNLELILSYPLLEDQPDIASRRATGWVNDLSYHDLLHLVQSNGLILVSQESCIADVTKPKQHIFKFRKAKPELLPDYLLCSGCGSCSSVCPAAALEMRPDTDGFLKPAYFSGNCTQCNQCILVCPSLNYKNQNTLVPDCFAARAELKMRAPSSSGGVFPILAEEVLQRGGRVFGAAWNEDFTVSHQGVDCIEQLDTLKKSKYLQSEPRDTFREVKALLAAGTPVLYSGCPCQIAGLKSMLMGRAESELLVTVDLLCSHVLSHKAFKRYLDENYGISNVRRFTFRDKRDGWNPTLQRIELKSGEVIYNDWSTDALQKGFHECLWMNDTCENCFWSTLPRTGDITLGDFWGIERFNPALNDQNGTSAVLLNTQKGKRLFDKIAAKLSIESVPLQFLLDGQLSGRRAKHKNHQMFQDLSKTKTFNDAARYALEPHYDIGLVALWSSDNYGTCLTYFALYHVLKDLGYTLALFERSLDAPYAPPIEKMQQGKVGLFQHAPYQPYELIAPTQSRAEMRAQAEKCDTILVGSDQLFRNSLYNALGQIVSLDWVPSYKKKIAYAASWGKDEILGTSSEKQRMKYYLDQFDAFSVRERGAVKLLKDEWSMEVQQVLDPVFLCGLELYRQLIDGFDHDLKEANYLFSYILDPDFDKEQLILAAGKALNLDATVVTDAFYASSAYDSSVSFHHVSTAPEERWLAYFCNSDFIITDSFHGVCIALLFHKNFIALCNSGRGASRFQSLLGILGLNDRLVYDPADVKHLSLLLQPIDYNAVDAILNEHKARSMKWLIDALSAKKDGGVTELDILRESIDSIRIRQNSIEQFFVALEHRICLIEQFSRDLEQRTSAVEMSLQKKKLR